MELGRLRRGVGGTWDGRSNTGDGFFRRDQGREQAAEMCNNCLHQFHGPLDIGAVWSRSRGFVAERDESSAK